MDKAPPQVRILRKEWAAALSLVCCCLCAAFFMLVPAVFILQPGWVAWPQGWMHTLRWILLGEILLLSGGSFLLAHRTAGCETLPPRWRRWIGTLTPLSLLPLGGVVSLLADILPLGMVSNGLFFLPVVIVSVVASRMIAGISVTAPTATATRRWAWWILAGATLFFTGIGYYVSTTTGEHVGDEGHYIVQAKSLFFDRDLDIKSNILEAGGDLPPADRVRMHVTIRSKDGHWYSWHPYGLSAMLAPFWPGGMPLRQLILGLISGAGCVGMFLLSLRVGASLRSSLVTLLFLATSVYWTLYSVRSLPETLGASLLIWVFWSIAAQKDKPWVSAAVATACCVYLPFAHFRFLPLSLMGFGLYGLFGLCSPGAWGSKVGRLAVLALLCLAGAAIYFHIQRAMFLSGASYSVKDVLFSYPLGAWAVLADSRGVTSVFPFFMWLAAAWIVWVATDRENRWLALGMGATFLACLVTSCTNCAYTGGSSLPGRYVLVVIPLLIPGAARLLDRSSPLARSGFVFLGMISMAVLVVTLVRLPSIGRDFVLPVQAISGHPLLRELFNPHSMFISGTSRMCWTTSIYVAAGILFVVLLLACAPRRKTMPALAFALLLGAGVAAHLVARTGMAPSDDAGYMAAELLKLDLDRATVIRRDASTPVPLFQVSRYLFRDVRNPQHLPGVTTRDLGERRVEDMLSQPHIEDNDWAGRGFRWATLTAPIAPPRGNKLIHVGGRIDGTATVIFAIREGSHTLFEGPLLSENGRVGCDVDVSCRGKSGHLYLLVRLEKGEGVFHLEELYWSPYSNRLLRSANLQLPDGRIQTQKAEK